MRRPGKVISPKHVFTEASPVCGGPCAIDKEDMDTFLSGPLGADFDSFDAYFFWQLIGTLGTAASIR